MVNHTADNVEKLASDIVADWDMDTLVEYAKRNVTNHYMGDEQEFHREWAEFYGDENA